jgi:hypothetical protein
VEDTRRLEQRRVRTAPNMNSEEASLTTRLGLESWHLSGAPPFESRTAE